MKLVSASRRGRPELPENFKSDLKAKAQLGPNKDHDTTVQDGKKQQGEDFESRELISGNNFCSSRRVDGSFGKFL